MGLAGCKRPCAWSGAFRLSGMGMERGAWTKGRGGQGGLGRAAWSRAQLSVQTRSPVKLLRPKLLV